jgi:hypothetical protein
MRRASPSLDPNNISTEPSTPFGTWLLVGSTGVSFDRVSRPACRCLLQQRAQPPASTFSLHIIVPESQVSVSALQQFWPHFSLPSPQVHTLFVHANPGLQWEGLQQAMF